MDTSTRTLNKYEKYNLYPKIYKTVYEKLHKTPLVPLDMMLDIEEIMYWYEEHFYVWGENKPHLKNRKGLALINLDGQFSKNDPSLGPLDIYNNNHSIHYLEPDFRTPTIAFKEKCFDPLRSFDLCRSSILSWTDGDHFVPHTDVVIPTVNLRLWGASNPYVELKFNGEAVDFEPGRVYLIDTSITHEARSIDYVYQFFIGLQPTEKNIDKIYELSLS